MNALLLVIYAAPFPLHFSPVHQISSERLQHYNKCLRFYCIILFIRRSFGSPLAPGEVRGKKSKVTVKHYKEQTDTSCKCVRAPLL